MSGDATMTTTICPRRAKVIEQIALTLHASGLRKVGIGSAEADAATAEVACEVAEVSARSGRRTLVLDLTGEGPGPHWTPDDSTTTPVHDPRGHAFDVISAAKGADVRAAFNNPSRLSEELDRQFKDYELLVLHFGGLVENQTDRVNSVAVAAAAEGIVMVCPTNETTVTAMKDAMNLVSAAGGKVVGTIMDDRSNPMLGDEIARVLRRFLRFVPPLGRWLGRRIANMHVLRTPIFP